MGSSESVRLSDGGRCVSLVQKAINAAATAHQQFGEINPRPSGLHNGVLQLIKKIMRRSLAWYTRPNYLFQVAVIRALQDITSVLERHEAASQHITSVLERHEAASQHITSVLERHEAALQQITSVLAAHEKAPWEVDFPAAATSSDIFYCFRLLLGRKPNRHEWPGHSIRVGDDLASVVGDYLSSQEFTDRNLLRRQLGSVALVDLPHFKIYVSPEDTAIGSVIAQTHDYEPPVTKIFQQYLRPGMVALDIGANIGYFSLLAASLVGSGGLVYAWEPAPSNVRLLYASQLANGFNNIQIVQAAATDRTRLLRYFSASSNGNVATLEDGCREDVIGAETVMGLRIDDLLPQDARVGFVKIDVEGHEFRAISGARQMLERSRPVVVSEFSPFGLRQSSDVDGQEYLEFFVRLGYDLFVITESGPVAGNINYVLTQFEQSGTDHIDILLEPRPLPAG